MRTSLVHGPAYESAHRPGSGIALPDEVIRRTSRHPLSLRAMSSALALIVALVQSTPAFAQSSASGGSPEMPAECATRSLQNSSGVAFWAFSVNFDIVDASGPIGCLTLFSTSGPPVYFSVPCQTSGAVAYADGFSFFQGGRVECGINLQTFVPTATNSLESAQIQGVGRLSSFETSSSPYRTPIAHYEPTSAGNGLGLFLRSSSLNGVISGLFRTATNGLNIESVIPSVFTVQATTAEEQTWSSTYWSRRLPTDTSFTLRNSVNGVILDSLNEGAPLPIDFRSDGGTFYIGGSPLGPSLLGTLQEVIVSSAYAYEPPKTPAVVPLDPPAQVFGDGFE